MTDPHLYRFGAESRERKAFEREYEKQGRSKADADEIYYKTVGKVKRESHSHEHKNGHHARGSCGPRCQAGSKDHPKGRGE